MRRLLISGVVVACAGASMATSPFYEKDWNPKVNSGPTTTITGTNHIYVTDGVNMKVNGYSDNSYVGIYNVKIGGKWANVLCCELDEVYNPYTTSTYRIKTIQGYAGYMANQIGVITSMAYQSLSQIQHSVALSLATWELAYDFASYDNGTNLASIYNGTYSGLHDSGVGGKFYISSITSGNLDYGITADMFTANTGEIDKLVAQYLHDAVTNNPSYYRMYHSPIDPSSQTKAPQDFIEGVPGPAAVLPFLMGFGVALRRRKK